MGSEFTESNLGKIFQDIDDTIVAYVMALAITCNNLSFLSLLLSEDKSEEFAGEQIYLFGLVLGHLKEIAKNIKIKEEAIMNFIQEDQEIKKCYENLSNKLSPFEGSTLTKDVLKKIRDLSFHIPAEEIKQCSNDIRKMECKIRFRNNNKGALLLEQRYIFADEFVSKLQNDIFKNNSYKNNEELNREITELVVELMGFVDIIVDKLYKKS